jgi:hypothetical protein
MTPAKPVEEAAGEPAASGEATAVEAMRVEGAAELALSPAEALALALSPEQHTAIEKMLSGHTLAASATAAGVTRMTLYRWLHHDSKFQAAYSAWQLDAITGARTKLLAMTDTAVNTVGRAVKNDAKLAMAVLKAVGVLDRPRPGSTDPEEVEKLMEIARLQKQNKVDEEYFFAKHLHGPVPGGDSGIEGMGLAELGLGSMGGGKKSGKRGLKLSDKETKALIAMAEKEFGL